MYENAVLFRIFAALIQGEQARSRDLDHRQTNESPKNLLAHAKELTKLFLEDIGVDSK